MNIKKLFLVFVTALIAQFSFALAAPASVALASPQVQQSNRVVDFHSMLDAGTYGIYSDATLLNGPPATGVKTAIVVYSYKDSYDKVVNQTVFDSDGSGWQEYYDYGTKKWSAWSQFGGGGGQKGDKGDKGDTGPQGLPGVKGDTGLTGQQGIQGIKGDTGLQGIKGDTGAQGIQGVAGKDGAQGAKGDTGVKGDTGAQGVKGDKGDTGDPAPVLYQFNVPAHILYAEDNNMTPAVITLKSNYGSTQNKQQTLFTTAKSGLVQIDQSFSLNYPKGKTLKLAGRATFYNVESVTQANYYVNLQVIGKVGTTGQLVNLGTYTKVDLSKELNGYTIANFSCDDTSTTDITAIGVRITIMYAQQNATALIDTLYIQATIT